MFYEVLPEGKVEALTYNFDDSLLPGQIVLVPIARRVVPGIIIKKVIQPSFKTKAIIKVLYSKPLPKHLLKTAEFIREYYQTVPGEVASLILPRGIEKKRRKTEQVFGFTEKTEQRLDLKEIQLNQAQKNALLGLQKAPGATKLLFGVTGSGKTNIYLELTKKALSEQKSTILLVPEIALTGQLVRVFREYFGTKVVLMHSGQTESERHLIFERILRADESLVVIGPRSALFAPLKDLGLIIIDEEHEGAYYQENAPRYSAIRVASFIAREAGASLVLGSATPTVEDYYIASKQSSVVKLTEKAKTTAIKPEISIIDLKNRDNFSRNKYFSTVLLKSIASNLEMGQQTLIFHNRRGSAPLTMCETCG